jgi:hypothetical protein
MSHFDIKKDKVAVLLGGRLPSARCRSCRARVCCRPCVTEG